MAGMVGEPPGVGGDPPAAIGLRADHGAADAAQPDRGSVWAGPLDAAFADQHGQAVGGEHLNQPGVQREAEPHDGAHRFPQGAVIGLLAGPGTERCGVLILRDRRLQVAIADRE